MAARLDPRLLRIGVSHFSHAEGGQTFQYHIQVEHDEASYEILKRFSEFDHLLQELEIQKYGNLPLLPPKTWNRPNDT